MKKINYIYKHIYTVSHIYFKSYLQFCTSWYLPQYKKNIQRHIRRTLLFFLNKKYLNTYATVVAHLYTNISHLLVL